MLFLIDYDRKAGQLVSFRTFTDSERKQAEDARLDLEESLFAHGIDREVVILEAASEEQIRITHSRYFYSLNELIGKLKTAIEAA